MVQQQSHSTTKIGLQWLSQANKGICNKDPQLKQQFSEPKLNINISGENPQRAQV